MTTATPLHAAPSREQVLDALRRVVDPEAGLNIVDLGLVYGVDVQPQAVTVRMTMTSAACPMTEMIVDDAHRALDELLAPDATATVELVWEPPWSPARLSAAARAAFGWTGEDA